MNGENSMAVLRNIKMQDQITQKTADTAAAGSAFLAGSAWIANVEPYITVLASFVAIVAGVAAAWYHIERVLHLRAKRKADEKANRDE
jgi:hypothetical protein